MSYLSTEAITEQLAHDERACGNGERQALQRLMKKHKANSLSQRCKLRAKGDCCTTGGLAGDDVVELTAARHDMRASLHDVAEYPSFGASTGRSSYDVLKAWKTCNYKRPQMQREVLSGGWKRLGPFIGSLLRATDLHKQSVKDHKGNLLKFSPLIITSSAQYSKHSQLLITFGNYLWQLVLQLDCPLHRLAIIRVVLATRHLLD